MKFLLSSGLSTDKIEYYIIDLFKLYLKIYPGDVPGTNFGFNFNMNGVVQADLPREVRSRVSSLVDLVKSNFNSGITIEVSSCEIISDTKARISINVNQIKSEDIEINLYRED